MLIEPSQAQFATFCAEMDVLISTPDMDRLVATYFDPEPTSQFAGFTFDSMGAGEPADEITPQDLVAVGLLDVRFKPAAVRALLDPGPLRTEVTARLREIPTDQDLWSDVNLLPASSLWRTLHAIDDIGEAKAGKLLAKKRPRLLPAYDGTVERAFSDLGACYWMLLRRSLMDEARRRKVDRLGSLVDGPVTTLRLLDVAVWMRHSKSWDANRARTRLGFGPPAA